jgi:hypothetical protein
LRQNLQQVAPNQEKPHTTPLHSLIYSIYISVPVLHPSAILSDYTPQKDRKVKSVDRFCVLS